MNNPGLWEFLIDSMNRDVHSALLLTLETSGSGPGRPGAAMAVTSDGRTLGTIGGGSMERVLIENARRSLEDRRSLPEVYRHFHSETGDSLPGEPSGMICSGSQVTALLPLSSSDLTALRSALSILRSGRIARILASPEGFRIDETANHLQHSFTCDELDNWEYTGPLGLPDTVYIVGGGHVGCALADLMKNLQFQVVIIDERERLIPKDPDLRWVTVPYGNACGSITEGNHSWVVIMTPLHSADSVVLESLAWMNLGYVGMMASSSKRSTIFLKLLDNGVSPDFLETVFSPVGLPIGSRTPREIAVSIAAQLISIRRGSE